MAPQLRALIIFLLPLLALAAEVATSITTTQHAPLARRGKGKALGKLFSKLLGLATEGSSETWDYEANPDMCEVYMETKDGGNCVVKVKCKDSGEKEYKKWNVCFVGGRQYFKDPRIGEFSVTFTKKDGDEGEGLTNPLLQVKAIDNWKKMWVTKLAAVWTKSKQCEDGLGSMNCDKDAPFVCGHSILGNQHPPAIGSSRTKKWWCGVPKLKHPAKKPKPKKKPAKKKPAKKPAKKKQGKKKQGKKKQGEKKD
ncbi:hypothetical protein AJ79_04748 [Helicocarpus griseus UAMH5409]|uniref:Uncharacterized protein n=1 Tax=Helicocarpus griseus UAMH5409 TaxID=1447875 RepID=A0A2B7XSN1_9EURO|nr:hypothetical protein AJ79_04748 [Helicocarpus griseus UAMH5409]